MNKDKIILENPLDEVEYKWFLCTPYRQVHLYMKT